MTIQSIQRRSGLAKAAAEFLLCAWILTFSIGITKIGPLPVKTLIFALFVVFSLYLILEKTVIVVEHKFGLCILFVWMAAAMNVGFINGYDSSTINHGSTLFATFLIVVLAFILYENDLLNSSKVENSIYLSAGIGVLIKSILGLGVVFGFFAADGIDNLMQNYVGSTSFHADGYGGFLGVLPRIGNAGDLFNLAVFLFYIRKYNGTRVVIAWALMLVFVLVTYSRYLILMFLIATIYAAGCNIRHKSKALIVACCLVVLSGAIRYTEADMIFAEFEERFTGYTQSRSDEIREEMKQVLLGTFADSPALGVGLGGYVREYVRSPTNLWQYELEYLQLLMQFGALGFILIVINFTAYVLRMIFFKYNKTYIIPLFISTLFWIGTPIQSSLFSGTQSAVIILSIFFLSRNTPSNRSKFTYPPRSTAIETAPLGRIDPAKPI